MSPAQQQRFVELSLAADAVICCRLTPQQKADLVFAVKAASSASPTSFLARVWHSLAGDEGTTLAIGDGGNDVPMIQEAHVGVGIVGKEGLQAARASDFAISRFKYLRPLILIHGRYSYERSAFVAQFSFFKSWWFCFIQIAFGSASQFSGVTLFDALAIMACNAVVGIPILFYCLHRDVDQNDLTRYPVLYNQGPSGALLNGRTLLGWLVRAFLQAIVSFTILTHALGVALGPHGAPFGYKELGIATFIAYVLVQCGTLLFETRCFTWPQLASILGLAVLTLVLYSFVNSIPRFNGFVDYYGFFMAFSLPATYLTIVLSVACCILPVIAIKYVCAQYRPSPLDAFLRAMPLTQLSPCLQQP